MTRAQWRLIHRLQRIALREHRKALVDMVAFGTGVVLIDSNAEAKHVPRAEWSMLAMADELGKNFPTAPQEDGR